MDPAPLWSQSAIVLFHCILYRRDSSKGRSRSVCNNNTAQLSIGPSAPLVDTYYVLFIGKCDEF